MQCNIKVLDMYASYTTTPIVTVLVKCNGGQGTGVLL